MLDLDIIPKILKRTLSRGGEYADIFEEQRRATYIHLEDGKIEKVMSGVDGGIGIRLLTGEKTAYAFSNDSSEASLVRLADALSKSFQGSAAVPTIDMREAKAGVDFIIRMFPDQVPMSEKIDLVERADRAARAFDRRIKQVSAGYRDSLQMVRIANSEGILAEDRRIHTLAIIHIIASDEGIIQTGYETAGGHVGFELFDGISVEDLAIEASKRAVMMLKAKRAAGGRMPVVISSEAGGTMIHEAVGHGLEADLAQSGLSVYSGKLGHSVASKLVTVVDDATIPGRRGSFRFDDEGIPSGRTVLVDKGTLTGFMYDRLTARRNGVRPTGNGRRESYRHRPIPRMTNTFIAPGDSSPGEVLKATAEGLFVRKMGGGQVNTVTGEFVFEVQEGYGIENGAIGDPVRDATLTGSGPDVLKAIDMVASDLGFSIGTCGKDSQGVPVSDAMPTLRIGEMVVGGEITQK